ncbi:zinc ribbon domain-containing protein [Coleofasciculus sp.]|uniref:zinc ribbon domain-containing protein n=1 Tax=Coleofasciculus sp. TaxID=3100458 RepID=UPI0039F98461
MFQVLTVSCKIEVSPQQVEKLDAVLRAFASCCEYVNKNTDPKLTNQIAVQSLIYREAREYSGLSAQMTIHAIRRVCANRKTAKQQNRPVKGFAPTSINQQPRSKIERRRSNSWTFYQFRQFMTYKAVKFGVNLVFVNPRYTSQTCYKCLHIHPVRGKSYRSGKRFSCGHCGWIGDADENGAKNISVLGLLLDQPGGSGLACSLEEHVLGLLKSHCSA